VLPSADKWVIVGQVAYKTHEGGVILLSFWFQLLQDWVAGLARGNESFSDKET